MLKLYNIRDLGNSHHTPLLTDYIAAYVDIFRHRIIMHIFSHQRIWIHKHVTIKRLINIK